MTDTIFQFIKEQETLYAQEIEVMEGWNWNMKEHIRMSMLYKHGKFSKGTNDFSRPNRNIVLPMLNLRYRAEDIDVKNVNIYVDDADLYHLSFLVKKYHDEVYVREHDLDTFFDEGKEEKIDFGGVLVRNGKNNPIIEPLESIAFCDQTDILSGPIGFKLFFAPDELYDMEKQGWGDTKNGATATLDELITLAEASKQQDKTKNKTPGKYIEVYRVHGMLPEKYLKDTRSQRYSRQLHIVAFYKDSAGLDTGVTLYKAAEVTTPFKLHLPGKKIRNRALVSGGVEELFDAQIWTNYSEIRKKDMLDAASKIVFQTTDESYANRQKIKNMDNLEITTTKDGSRIDQIPNGSQNIQFFNEWMNEWRVHSQLVSGATDALLGRNPSHGTSFRLENLMTQQGQGLHTYRQGKYATFLAEVYKDWIIPKIQEELVKGKKFFATLSGDEMEYVSDCLVRNKTNEMEKERILSGELMSQDDIEAFKTQIKSEFMKSNKKFIEILKDEIKNASLAVEVNIMNKQKDLAGISDKLNGVFRQVFATYNPQTGKFGIFEDQRMLKVFMKLVEYAGLNPSDFASSYSPPTPAIPQQTQQQVPQQIPQQVPQQIPQQVPQQMTQLPVNSAHR